ncbi:MAG: type II toxin-antitoxin system RelE/ParE family toxin [Deltaproteobacteria bacterium]|nr:type II toxin-antitoxin system RelE/ParE family toxin [Deltaproteobacteria bacterium]
MADKPLVWIGSSRRDLLEFSDEARRRAGFELRAVQRGDDPSDFKPMPLVGPGVYEIRIQTGDVFRLFYVTKFEEGVYVLHAFQKKTQKTPARDIAIGQQRYKSAQEIHQQGKRRRV